VSFVGKSFTGAFAGGSHVDFGVGSAGLSTALAGNFTIAVLARTVSSNWGLFGDYNSTDGTNPIRQFFLSNNSGGRLFGDGDFSNGFPDAGTLPGGLNDNVWRWYVFTKTAGTSHYRMHYADLATLTWVHGESVGAGNHTDNATTALMFSTWNIYPQGFDSGDIAAMAVWSSTLADVDIVTSCTKNAATLNNVVAPKGAWLCKPNANTAIKDVTGGGADESARQNAVASADPPGWSSLLDGEESLWLPTDGPAGGANDFSDGTGGITTATSVFVTVPGQITAIRFVSTLNAQSAPSAVYRGTIWHVDTADDIATPLGTKIAQTATFLGSDVVAGAVWNEIPLTAPLNVTPGNLYRVGIHSGNSGRYVATNHGYDGPHTSAGGHLKASGSLDTSFFGTQTYQGVFALNASPDVYPFGLGLNANYWIDVVFSPGGAPAFDATRFLPFF
jgi:uncharacterized protein DUF4082